MPGRLPDLIRTVETNLLAQDAELIDARHRELLSVVSRTTTGSGDIDHTFGLDRKYRLVFVRCHFTGAAGTTPLTLSVDAGEGSAYDARLFTISQAGVDKDVHLRIAGGDTDDPSAWTFQPADKLRVQWISPDSGNITWGLEIGLALAS